MTLLQIMISATDFPMSPFLSNLVPAILAAFGVQFIFGIHGILFHTEFFYDFSGGWTFFLTLLSSFVVPVLRRGASIEFNLGSALETWNWRQLVFTGATLVYSTKLSTFLFCRVIKERHDSRFEKMRHNPRRFALLWTVQAVWVTLCCLPTIAVNSIHPAAFKAGMGVPSPLRTDVIGLGLFAFGLMYETVADYQKWVWFAEKKRKVHDEQFITRGLWGRSRYPNYLGDITLWTGMAIAAAGVLTQGPIKAHLGWWGLAGQLKALLIPGLAPAFVAWALLRASGVPLSEAKYDRLYGDRKDYQQWRRNTPLLFPKIW
ncbi:hypothetical protein OQA88_7880 [Cercophora sp. LCS_1]